MIFSETVLSLSSRYTAFYLLPLLPLDAFLKGLKRLHIPSGALGQYATCCQIVSVQYALDPPLVLLTQTEKVIMPKTKLNSCTI